MNYKILLGISSITILTLIFQYIKNVFNPNKRLLEGQEAAVTQGEERGFGEFTSESAGSNRNLNLEGKGLINPSNYTLTMEALLKGIYDELGEFNHVYQERMYENLFPTQIRKTIVHLSSIDHRSGDKGEYIFDLGSFETNGLRKFDSIINMKLLSAQIPYVPHNIYEGDGNHNRLYFIGASMGPIPVGKYTIFSLINKINSLLTNITFSFDSVTQYISIKNGTVSPITIDVDKSPLFKRLGFNVNVEIGASNTQSSGNLPDISIHYIDIISPDIHPRASSLSTNVDTVLKRIPLTGQLGDLIYYEANHSDYISQELFIPDSTSNLSTLHINLKRHDGTLYDLKNLHFDLKMEITELVEQTLLTELASHMKRDKARFMDSPAGDKGIVTR